MIPLWKNQPFHSYQWFGRSLCIKIFQGDIQLFLASLYSSKNGTNSMKNKRIGTSIHFWILRALDRKRQCEQHPNLWANNFYLILVSKKSTTRSVGVQTVRMWRTTVRCGPRFPKPSFNESNSIEHYRKCFIFIIFWPFPIRNNFIIAFPKLVRKTVISISKKRNTLSLFIICAQKMMFMAVQTVGP